MVKPIIQIYPVIPASDEERERLRPIGRNRQLYHQVLKEWLQLAQAADDLGFWGLSTIEHHFHSEGFEVGPNPGIIDAWLAAHTKRARLGQLGYVMTTQNPLRVAEETAILDHILEGRFFVGFARGYQARWTNIMGQAYNTRATLSTGDEADALNRRIFEEMVDIVLKAWTQDAIDYKGHFFQIPYPYDTGITDYPAYPAALKYGAPGEIGPNNEVRRISVVPAPYQQPHPPVFVSTIGSLDSARWCGRKGFIPTYFLPTDRAVEYGQVYRDEAQAAGHDFAFGQNEALVRWMHIGESKEEVFRKIEEYDVPLFTMWYRWFFPRILDVPGESWAERILNSGLLIAGTLDEVKRQFVETFEKFPAEYLVLIWHFAQEPLNEVLEEMELFATKVLPELP